jgi:hypothetical protein
MQTPPPRMTPIHAPPSSHTRRGARVAAARLALEACVVLALTALGGVAGIISWRSGHEYGVNDLPKRLGAEFIIVVAISKAWRVFLPAARAELCHHDAAPPPLAQHMRPPARATVHPRRRWTAWAAESTMAVGVTGGGVAATVWLWRTYAGRPLRLETLLDVSVGETLVVTLVVVAWAIVVADMRRPR